MKPRPRTAICARAELAPRVSQYLTWAIAVLVSACSGTPTSLAIDAGASAGIGAAGDPTFLRHAAAAPGFSALDTSFVAVAGERQQFRVFRIGSASGSERFLDLDLDDESLVSYPAGHPRAGQNFVPGDTITITVTIDPNLLVVTLGPEGMLFDEEHPAKLEMSYRNADPDFDGDGTPDPGLEPSIGMFRQATDGAPWILLPAELDLLTDRVKFDEVTSFSRYALAF